MTQSQTFESRTELYTWAKEQKQLETFEFVSHKEDTATVVATAKTNLGNVDVVISGKIKEEDSTKDVESYLNGWIGKQVKDIIKSR